VTPRQALAFVRRHGLVLESGHGRPATRARPAIPSLAEAIAGGPIRGSWWAHPASHSIFRVLGAVRASEDVLACRLVDGRVTLVHRRLWPALVAAAESGQPWQTRDLKADAKQLLRRVRLGKPVQTDARRPANDLERRLLARSYTEHTASGRHVRFLEPWLAWGRRSGVPADLPDAAEAIQALSAPVMAWASDRRPPGLLPWLAAR